MAYYNNTYGGYQPQPNGYSYGMDNNTNPYSRAQTPNGNIVWVQGRAGAEAYPVAPGNRLMLMDSNEPVIYVKQADMSGRMMPLIIYDLVERVEVSNAQQIPAPVEAIDYDKIRKIISEEVAKQTAHSMKKEAK